MLVRAQIFTLDRRQIHKFHVNPYKSNYELRQVNNYSFAIRSHDRSSKSYIQYKLLLLLLVINYLIYSYLL